MTNLFSGRKALRSQYVEMYPGAAKPDVDCTGANKTSNAVCVALVNQPSKPVMIANGTGADIVLLVQSPEGDNGGPSDASNVSLRLRFMEIPKNTTIDLGSHLVFDVGTRIWAYISNGTIADGEKFRMLLVG